ncbi:four helix bundle protein [Salegentibacter salegens]|uniref:Four helix bundle protein n=2 Tax=Salegentibacter salegens TaxID=143223 RepID=A0A1M7NEK6_9FLAO|nr:four helix bundle protein [Salegentibacter salegens]PRX41545.1 four helix bundle protein [Salegentibacter salegens]SHN01787.1 four helix bundle protein [Salegentibacter salegens]
MNHKDLDVWKRSIDLVEEIYKLTSNFPSSEIYGLTNQLRRASVSIPSNIAEGAVRKGDKELLYFINIAIGSVAEIETQLIIAERLDYINDGNNVFESAIEVRKLLLGFRNYLNRKE